MIKDKNCLVTGGAGFIGSHVASELLMLGNKVVILDDLSGGHSCNVPNGAVLVRGSVTDDALVESVFSQHSISHVYHLAAYAAEGLSHFVRRFNYATNVIGSATVINASIRHKVSCFVFTSSIAVYGSGAGVFRECDTPSPEDPYGISKYTIEMDLKCANRLFGLNYVIFRPHNVYGIRQNLSDPYRNVIGIFMNKCLSRLPLPIFGSGLQTRSFTHVSDVALPIAKSGFMPECYGKTLNIGNEASCTTLELASLISDVMNVPLNLKMCPNRSEAKHAHASHTELDALFTGQIKHTCLREGLIDMARWARSMTIKPLSSFNGIEITEGLPPSWIKQ